MFHSPIFLLLLLLLPWCGFRMRRAAKRKAVSFSDLSNLSKFPTTVRQKLSWIPAALWFTAMSLLIISLAGPREGRQQISSDAEGIAIELVVDRSDSMRAMDFQIQEQPVDRLTAVKEVVSKFVLGKGDLPGRPNDLIGLIAFAGIADGVSPPTLDHGFLVSQLNATQITERRNESGTAIGDALALAVEKLTALDKKKEQKITNKIIILLTDGENNAGDLQPIQAAELAKALSFKVYTIGVGTQGRAPIPMLDPFSRREVMQMMEVRIDEESLKAIADMTGGRYFRATDTQSLENIYAEIDKLEKSIIKDNQFIDYRELAIQPMQVGSIKIPPMVLCALAALALHLFLRSTYFREFV